MYIINLLFLSFSNISKFPLKTSLAVPHQFLLYFHSFKFNYFLISLKNADLLYLLFSNVLFNIQEIWSFPFSCYLLSGLIWLRSKDTLCMMLLFNGTEPHVFQTIRHCFVLRWGRKKNLPFITGQIHTQFTGRHTVCCDFKISCRFIKKV